MLLANNSSIPADVVKTAIREDRIMAAYQPIVDITSGKIVAEEALARLTKPGHDPVPAAQFIDIAEQLQLTHQIDNKLARDTIIRCGNQVAAGHAPISHFVNISADLLRHPDLVQGILDLAIESCTTCFAEPPEEKPLVIEITEREVLDNVAEARRLLEPFIEFGLRLAIDDFGSGYSSLLYLADLPVTFLKIEGELIRRAPHEKKVYSIIKGVQDLADELGLTTIAEYVEDERILDAMREIGVNLGQGYHFGRPELPEAH